jgi:transposase
MSRDARVIPQAYRFALAPTAEQEEFLSSCCGASRFWFDHGLALVKDRLDRHAAGEEVRVPWSYKALCSEFAPLKDEVCPWPLSLAERVFTCDEPACGHVQDRDLNAARNLAHMAARHAQAQGLESYVAATEAETQNARGGQVRLDPVEHSPVKRVDPSGSPQHGDALALAT